MLYVLLNKKNSRVVCFSKKDRRSVIVKTKKGNIVAVAFLNFGEYLTYLKEKTEKQQKRLEAYSFVSEDFLDGFIQGKNL